MLPVVDAMERQQVDVVRPPDEPVRVLMVVSAATEFLYKPFTADPPLFRRRADWFRQNRAFKIDKAKKELGYIPKVVINIPWGIRKEIFPHVAFAGRVQE